jgi:hypothetical protein
MAETDTKSGVIYGTNFKPSKIDKLVLFVRSEFLDENVIKYQSTSDR